MFNRIIDLLPRDARILRSNQPEARDARMMQAEYTMLRGRII